eukprot:UN00507
MEDDDEEEEQEKPKKAAKATKKSVATGSDSEQEEEAKEDDDNNNNTSSQAASGQWEQICDQNLWFKRAHRLPEPLLGVEPKTKEELVLPKIASFDFDHTIAYPKSGDTFGQDANDYAFMSPNVLPKLRELYKEGYDIVIFTNQAGCVEKKRINMLKQKFDNVEKEAGIPMSWYISCDKNMFRKPSRGMWDFMLDHYFNLLHTKYPTIEFTDVIDWKNSYYVGDAAGRPGVTKAQAKKTGGREKDFSSGDIDFAYNVFGESEIWKHFYVPESFFGYGSQQWVCKSNDDIKNLGPSHNSIPYTFTDGTTGKLDIESTPLYKHLIANDTYKKPCVVLLVAPPASGKTHLADQIIKVFTQKGQEFVWANRDTLKTIPACQKVCQQALAAGKSAVIDNTNVTSDDRAAFIEIAKNAKVPVHAVVITPNKPLSFHLSNTRAIYTLFARDRLPSVALHTSYKKWQEPTKDEGFETITNLTFQITDPVPIYTSTNPAPMVPQGVTAAYWEKKKAAQNQDQQLATSAHNRQSPYGKVFGEVTLSRTLTDLFYQRYDE